MIQQISDKILEKLQTLTGTDQPLVSVYDYHTIENDWYPYACFELVDFTWEYSDTCNNDREYIFDIIVFQEITASQGRQEAVKIIYNCLDDILLTIDQDYTLGWVVNRWVVPIDGNLQPLVVQNWSSIVWTLRVNCRTTEFIS